VNEREREITELWVLVWYVGEAWRRQRTKASQNRGWGCKKKGVREEGCGEMPSVVVEWKKMKEDERR